ncbi:hypothetical protein GOQ27_08155 [Clostridium sp. D2Q-11]|uniref:Uncharacterized protein n=1 Tax=Anaeromonas frigoriresistens TaxID=2683708 RepID=A0A942UVU3_9FIRM|nr:hypothetical protein [Anaeromonas frigoriresistens]MBS4538435.1 hypothetical protein [Anaeromonas frigoriresistens]
MDDKKFDGLLKDYLSEEINASPEIIKRVKSDIKEIDILRYRREIMPILIILILSSLCFLIQGFLIFTVFQFSLK